MERLENFNRDFPFTYTIVRNPRSIRIRLRIKGESVSITAPPSVHQRVIDEFIRQNLDWIRDKIQTEQKRKTETPVYGFLQGEKFPVLGQVFDLEFAESPRPDLFLRDISHTFVIWHPTGKIPSAQAVRSLLLKWYHQKALEVFAERLAYFNTFYGFNYGKIYIRDQKTRWGSCSGTNNLSFNFRLMLAPPEMLDYVVVHELSHLKEKNHGPKFWSLVSQQIPDYKARRNWLKKNGHKLIL